MRRHRRAAWDTPELDALCRGPFARAVRPGRARHRSGRVFSPAPPLHVGGPVNPRNKVLWLVRRANGDVRLTAHPKGASSPRVLMKVAHNGDGLDQVPSYDNVPFGGCWEFSVNEGKISDTLGLDYIERKTPR